MAETGEFSQHEDPGDEDDFEWANARWNMALAVELIKQFRLVEHRDE